MTRLTLTKPSIGEKNTLADPKIDTCFTTVETWANGEVDSTNIKAEGVKESNLELALQEKLTSKVGLTLTKKNESLEGVTENLYLMEKEGSTLTLPAATANRFIGITTITGIKEVKVKASAGKIFGDFLAAAGVTEVVLLENQHIMVEATGANWLIVAGEPKRTQKYEAAKAFTKAEVEAGVEPSATRPAFVVFEAKPTALTIGGQLIPGTSTGGYWVNPGQTWKGTSAATTSTILL